MNLISVAGIFVFIITSLAVSLRMFLLWRRTRETPELLLALALFFVGFLAFALGTAGKLLLTGTATTQSVLTIEPASPSNTWVMQRWWFLPGGCFIPGKSGLRLWLPHGSS